MRTKPMAPDGAAPESAARARVPTRSAVRPGPSSAPPRTPELESGAEGSAAPPTERPRSAHEPDAGRPKDRSVRDTLECPVAVGFAEAELGARDAEFEQQTTAPGAIGAANAFPAGWSGHERVTLTQLSGPEPGRVCSLGVVAVLGRDRGCDVRLDDGGVSRVHARISRRGEGLRYQIEDLDSRNGTFVGGKRVKQAALRDRDRIQLGPSVCLQFALTDDVEMQLLRNLYESSMRDALTGLCNRRHFDERLSAECSYARRHHTPLALIMLDVDRFKEINDSAGHPAGDHVLKTVARLVGCMLRNEDVLARHGGDEFGLIARGIDAAGGAALGERIRSTFHTARIVFEDKPVPVTLSLGVASSHCCGDDLTPERLVELADRRLCEAKLQGRNRVVGPR